MRAPHRTLSRAGRPESKALALVLLAALVLTDEYATGLPVEDGVKTDALATRQTPRTLITSSARSRVPVSVGEGSRSVDPPEISHLGPILMNGETVRIRSAAQYDKMLDEFYYTTDGSEPTASSQHYDKELGIQLSGDDGTEVTLKTLAVREGETSSVSASTFKLSAGRFAWLGSGNESTVSSMTFTIADVAAAADQAIVELVKSASQAVMHRREMQAVVEARGKDEGYGEGSLVHTSQIAAFHARDNFLLAVEIDQDTEVRMNNLKQSINVSTATLKAASIAVLDSVEDWDMAILDSRNKQWVQLVEKSWH